MRRQLLISHMLIRREQQSAAVCPRPGNVLQLRERPRHSLEHEANQDGNSFAAAPEETKKIACKRTRAARWDGLSMSPGDGDQSPAGKKAIKSVVVRTRRWCGQAIISSAPNINKPLFMVLFQSVQTGSCCLLLTETAYCVSGKKKENFTSYLWWTWLTSSFLRYATLSQGDFINIVKNHFMLTQTLAHLSIWVLYKMVPDWNKNSLPHCWVVALRGKKTLKNSNSIGVFSFMMTTLWILSKERLFPRLNHNKTENDISFLPTWSLKIFEITTGTLCSAPPWQAEETIVKCLPAKTRLSFFFSLSLSAWWERRQLTLMLKPRPPFACLLSTTVLCFRRWEFRIGKKTSWTLNQRWHAAWFEMRVSSPQAHLHLLGFQLHLCKRRPASV